MGDIVFLQVEFLAISHKLHDEQHRFHRSPTSFPCNYAGFEFSPYAIFQRHAQHHVLPNCGREHCLLQREPTPRLPTAVGSLVGSQPRLPSSHLREEVRPTHRGKSIPRVEERLKFLCHFYPNKPGITFDKNQNSLTIMTFTFLMYMGSGALLHI